jgi:MFS transporter, OFA family, oxalate/formate antiporter
MRFNRSRFKIFYGWWIVAAAVVIALYVGGAIFYAFTAIFEPIADEMGWSYTQISFAASLRGMEMGLLAPLIGLLVDRWGPRRLVLIGTVVAAAGLLLLSRVDSLGMFYAAFVLIALGTSCTTMTALVATVAQWFHRRLGMASGIAISGYGLGGLLVPVVVSLIATLGWRMAINWIALGMLVVIMPLALVLRHKPEQYGYLPDGDTEARAVPANIPQLPGADEADVKVGHALRSITFWRITVVFLIFGALLQAVITHVMPYLSSIGMARSKSQWAAAAIPLASVGGRLGLGWLGDKFDTRKVLAVALAMMGLGLLCYGYIAHAGTWLIVPFLILFGTGYGGCLSTRTSLARAYFGRANFGSIFGLMVGLSMLGSIAGAPVAGWVYDTWGSYQGVWLTMALLTVPAILSIINVKQVAAAAEPSGRA